MIKKELLVFTTSRKLRKFIDSKSDSIIPKTMLISDFFNKSIYSLKYNEISKIEKLFSMQKAIHMTQNLQEKLQISSNFFEFLNNHEYIFSFFKELAVTKKEINDLKNSDVYATYDEHLEILDELLKNYKTILRNRALYDEITIVDEYEINQDFIEYYDEIDIYIDGILTNFELEILKKCVQYSNLNLILNANYLTKKMLGYFIDINDELEIGEEYKFNLNKKELTKYKSCNINHRNEILVRGLHGNSMQCFYIFEKISTFIKNGMDAKNIAVILPDEEFSEILMEYDRTNMLNFAMGKKVQNSLFYKLLKKLSVAVLEDENIFLCDEYIKNNLELSSINIFLNECGIEEKFFTNFKQNFYKEIDFIQFKECILKALEYSKNSELSETINQILFDIEIYLSREKLTLHELLEIFLMELKNIKLDYVGGGEVSVMGLLESRGLSFDGVIIPCFNDDLVPKRSVNEMFLNSMLRKKAGLVSYEDRQNLQRFYYKNIIHKAKKVAICYDNSEHKIASRFLKEFEVIDDLEYSNKSYLNIFKSKNNFKNMDLKLVFKHDFFEEPLSFSRLNLFLKCPRCYAIKYILKIKPPKNVDMQIQAKDKGIMLHKAFEMCYEKSAIFDYAIFEESFLKLAENMNELEKNIILDEFADASIVLQEHEKKGYRLMQKELEITSEFEGIMLTGKIDRIDELNGNKFIIDYKSGSINDKNSLQLPFYEALINENNTKSAFFSIKDAKFVPSSLGLEDLRREIEKLKNISGKDFDFNISYDCKYKDYEILCD